MPEKYRFLDIFRWHEWGPDKISFLFNYIFFIGLRDRLFFYQFLYDFIVLAGFLSAMAAYGYLINELGDKESDRLVEKANVFQKLSSRSFAYVFFGVLLFMVLCGFHFSNRPWFVILWAGQIGLATIYSLPPFRLKARGMAGLVANVGAQFTLPTAIIFAACDHFASFDTVLFMICSTLIWTAPEIGHQRLHFHEDASSCIETLAVRIGYARISRWYGFTLKLSQVGIGLLIAGLLVRIPWIFLPFIHLKVPPALPLALAYLVLLKRCNRIQEIKPESHAFTDPYLKEVRNILNILHALFPNIVCPLYLCTLLVWYEWRNILLLIFICLWILPAISARKSAEIIEILVKRRK